MKRAVMLTVSLLWTCGIAAAAVTSDSGTFFKGPALGGVLRSHDKGTVIVITGESAIGSVNDGILTGSVEYSTKRETIDFVTGNGEFHITMLISKENGSRIVVNLDGETSGAFPTAAVVSISGGWRIMSASGPDGGLHGNGTFTGTENFLTGETNGNFSGEVRTKD